MLPSLSFVTFTKYFYGQVIMVNVGNAASKTIFQSLVHGISKTAITGNLNYSMTQII